MAPLNLRRFSNPENLRRIAPEHLVALLDPYRGYFEGRGVTFPPPDEKNVYLDCAGLVQVFLAPDANMPQELVEALYLIHELASPTGMDALSTVAREQGIALDRGRSNTPLDIAVLAYLRDRAFVEEVHERHGLLKKRGYVYYRAWGQVPLLGPVDGDIVERLRAELDDYYAAHNRGRHCRIFVFQREGKTWFTVRHGDTFKREVNLEKGRDGGCVFTYRPECYNVLVYDDAACELGVHASSDRERNLYRKLIGKHFFGFEETFIDSAKFTLEPLVKAGPSSLACSDIHGMEWVKLVEIHYERNLLQNPKEIRRASDLFDCYRNEIVPLGSRLLEAVFRVKFRGARSARRLALSLPNEVRHSRESDAAITEQWLRMRGFLRDRNGLRGGLQS